MDEGLLLWRDWRSKRATGSPDDAGIILVENLALAAARDVPGCSFQNHAGAILAEQARSIVSDQP